MWPTLIGDEVSSMIWLEQDVLTGRPFPETTSSLYYKHFILSTQITEDLPRKPFSIIIYHIPVPFSKVNIPSHVVAILGLPTPLSVLYFTTKSG